MTMSGVNELVSSVLVIILSLEAVTSYDLCTSAVCSYDLVVSFADTMTYPATSPPDGTILTDGVKRQMLVVNGQYPGPPIQVVHGCKVVVQIHNNITAPLTIHFHGMRQMNTWYMDGAATVTNFFTFPGNSFQHCFTADPVGTHWYHEHARLAYADGLYGMFIVYPQGTLPPSSPLQADFLVTVNDWYHQMTSEIYAKNPALCSNGGVGAVLKTREGCLVDGTDLMPETFQSALLGGRGRFGGNSVPLVEYVVASGSTRRFRMVNSGFWFPLQISIDGHQMRIVASDGAELKPVVVDSFYIFTGERIDFEVDANQPSGRYWIRARPACRSETDEARGILVYSGSSSSGDPTTRPKDCTAQSSCTEFNCPFARYPDGSYKTCLTWNDVQSTRTNADLNNQFGINDPDSDVLTYFINFGFSVGCSINSFRFRYPATPFYLLNPKDCPAVPCVDSCNCQCTHSLELPFNRTVQFVVSNLLPNESIMENGADNLHFHGYPFAVMTQRFPQYDPVSGYSTIDNPDVSCGSELCWNPTWSAGPPSFTSVTNPPIKDTIIIPSGGYEVLRFRTTNPGPFMLHCHLDVHALEGMAMIIDVAPQNRANPDFFTCDDGSSTTSSPKVIDQQLGKCRHLKGREKLHCRLRQAKRMRQRG